MDSFGRVRGFLEMFDLDASLRLMAYQTAIIAFLAHAEHSSHSAALLLVNGNPAFGSAWHRDANYAYIVGVRAEDRVWLSAECAAALDQLRSLLKLLKGEHPRHGNCPLRRVPLCTEIAASVASCLVTVVPGVGSVRIIRDISKEQEAGSGGGCG